MKVAWNLKDGGITGFTVAEDELPLLHDVLICHSEWLPKG